MLVSCSGKIKIKERIMTEQKFWEIVEGFSPKPYNQLIDIRKSLTVMTKEELIGFDERLTIVKNQLINRELYAVLALVYEGGGDDDFFDFKHFIVYQGKEVFEISKNNVDDLAKMLGPWRNYINWIDYSNITYQIFEERFDEDLGDYNSVEHSDDSEGEPIDIDDTTDLKKRFPQLYKIRAR